MSCERQLPELREAALGAVPSAALTAHLAECEACRAQLQAERQLSQRLEGELRAALQVSPSLGFRAGALRRAEERKRRPRPKVWSWLAAAALLLLSLRQLDWPSHEPVVRPAPRVGETVPPALIVEAPVVVAPAARPARVRVVRAPTAQPRVEPEVLVPPDQALLLRRLVERLEAPTAPTSLFVSREALASTVSAIDVAPIDTRPLNLEREDVQPLRIEATSEGVS